MDPVRNREVPQQGFNDTFPESQQASRLEKKTESVSSREFETMEGLSEAVSVLKIARSPKQSEKPAEGIDSLLNKMKTSFDLYGEKIVSAAISLFADANLPDWPADEAQQKLYILTFIENLATDRLSQVMQK